MKNLAFKSIVKLILTALPVMIMLTWPAMADAPSFRFTVNMDESVDIDTSGGTPSIPIDVGGQTRTAIYTAGSGSSSLTFTYTATPGDLDLDGITVSSPMQKNGGTITDLAGNPIADADLAFTPPITTGVKISYPSLSMDFINDRYSYNGTTYNSFAAFKTASNATFTNDTNGTYFNGAGIVQKTSTINTPRIDYDPATHAVKGLLIEESRTNYVPYSTDLTNGAWQAYHYSGSVTPSTDPQGYVAFRLNMSGSGAGATPNYSGIFMNNLSAPATGDFTLSFRARFSTTAINSFWLGLSDGQSATSGTLLRDGIEISATRSGTLFFLTSAMIPDTNWHNWEIRLQGVNRAGGCCAARIFQLAEGQLATFDLDVSRIQVEIGASSSSYIPTSGSTAVTRAADAFTIPATGGWYSTSESTLSTDSLNGEFQTSVQTIASLNNSASPISNRMSIVRASNSSTIEGLVLNNNAYEFQNNASANGNFQNNKAALGIKQNNTRFAINNTLGSLDSSVSLPMADRLQIGTWSGTSAFYNGWIGKVRYYPLRVSDTQLQLLTQ